MVKDFIVLAPFLIVENINYRTILPITFFSFQSELIRMVYHLHFRPDEL